MRYSGSRICSCAVDPSPATLATIVRSPAPGCTPCHPRLCWHDRSAMRHHVRVRRGRVRRRVRATGGRSLGRIATVFAIVALAVASPALVAANGPEADDRPRPRPHGADRRPRPTATHRRRPRRRPRRSTTTPSATTTTSPPSATARPAMPRRPPRRPPRLDTDPTTTSAIAASTTVASRARPRVLRAPRPPPSHDDHHDHAAGASGTVVVERSRCTAGRADTDRLDDRVRRARRDQSRARLPLRAGPPPRRADVGGVGRWRIVRSDHENPRRRGRHPVRPAIRATSSTSSGDVVGADRPRWTRHRTRRASPPWSTTTTGR